jgi:hypothetical protein
LLGSGLKLHKMKFVRKRVVLCSKKRRSYLNGDLFSGSFLLGTWRLKDRYGEPERGGENGSR